MGSVGADTREGIFPGKSDVSWDLKGEVRTLPGRQREGFPSGETAPAKAGRHTQQVCAGNQSGESRAESIVVPRHGRTGFVCKSAACGPL